VNGKVAAATELRVLAGIAMGQMTHAAQPIPLMLLRSPRARLPVLPASTRHRAHPNEARDDASGFRLDITACAPLQEANAQVARFAMR
jgi:hypothetical protein